MPAGVAIARQVHGNEVVKPGAAGRLPVEADALIAAGPLAVGVLTADCVPILIADPAARLVAADSADVMPSAADITPARKLANIVQISEAKAILETLAACGGSRIAAARQLGISERTLRYRLASLREAGLPVVAMGGGRR